ncbi:hypothetical protein ACIHFE_31225 [Streptomyces sp. NPDC052396]|uniref:hypothetical protein n=1 Tax=Streptomyces sp. NPDC052396 TaxID=3365689 RepID=UPI0037D88164
MTMLLDRDIVCAVLESREHPLRRFDLVLEVFWAAGYDREVYRTVYDLPETQAALARLVDRMRREGTLVLLSDTGWRQLLGGAFQPGLVTHGHRGRYWYATAAQHTRWRRAVAGRQARIAAIADRLKAGAGAELLAHAPSDLAFLLSLVQRDHPAGNAEPGPRYEAAGATQPSG